MKWVGFGFVAAVAGAAIVSLFASQAVVASRTDPPTAIVTVHFEIRGGAQGDLAPDGKHHDTFKAIDATAVPAGSKVTIVVDNYDTSVHGMSFPALKLNQMIAAGKPGAPSVTTFSLNAGPTGTLRWYCPVPCDSANQLWAMTASTDGPGRDGFMAGVITVK